MWVYIYTYIEKQKEKNEMRTFKCTSYQTRTIQLLFSKENDCSKTQSHKYFVNIPTATCDAD